MPRRSVLPWLCLPVAALLPFLLGDYAIVIANDIVISSIVCLGLVLLTGVTGLISFGQAAFVGLGAYTTAYLTTTCGLSPWITLPLALLLTGMAAACIGALTLHMSGHYLALATLAWGISIFYLIGNNPYLGQFNGIGGIPALSFGGHELRQPWQFFYVGLACLAASIWVLGNLLDSRMGRAIRAIRSGADLAENFGANSAILKIIALVVSADLAALAGWLYAHFQRFVNPTPFGITMGIEYLFMTVIGGAAHIGGAVLGATAVTLLKQWLGGMLPTLLGLSGNFETVVFGALMLIVLQYAREGLWPHVAALAERLDFAAAARDLRSPDAAGDEPAFSTVTPRSANSPMLRLRKISKSFGGLLAVRDLSFDVRQGEIVALLGPNGAGKSTTFNLVSGGLPVSGGAIYLGCRRIDNRASRHIAALGVGRTFQHVKIVPEMSVIENVALGAYHHGGRGLLSVLMRLNRDEERAHFADAWIQLQRVGLADKGQVAAGNLPLGLQRLLEIARALALKPRLLLLDEPAAGLRFEEKNRLATLLIQLRREGMTILIVEHDMGFVAKIADRLVVMQFGEKLADGSPETVRSSPDVIKAYLGTV